jgi:predicted ABC-type ATPase
MTTPHRNHPTLHLIAGPNGAGKTTFAWAFLPTRAECIEFLNADLIAAGLSPFAPANQDVEAGRILLKRVRDLSATLVDFAIETTLSGRTYVRIVKLLQQKGYRVCLYFLWLPDAEWAVARVHNRVVQGGHSIPDETIRRRYIAGLKNLFTLYQEVVDAWWLFDNSGPEPELIALELDAVLQVFDPDKYHAIESEATTT